MIHNPVRHNRIFFVFLVILLTLPGVSAIAQGNGVICSAVQSRIGAKPGTIVAVSIKIKNTTSESQTYTSTMDLPLGWRQVIREFPFEIKAGATDVRLITISIPSDAPASLYEMHYSVKDKALPVHESTVTIEVDIIKINQLDLQLMQSPRFSVAGKAFTTTVLIVNQGNSSGIVRLSCKSSKNFPILADSTFLNLAPKESRQIQIIITPDEKSGKTNHTLEVDAKLLQDTTVRDKISSVVEIIPSDTKIEEEYFRYPVSLRVREVGQNGKFSPQAEVYGYGSLSESKTDILEFLFRGPETQTKSTLGQRDEYKVTYRRENLELRAGDQNYSLSTLTEAGRYATGFGGKFSAGGLSAGGFYNTSRWSSNDQKELGGFINYSFIKQASLGVNYLRKREEFSSDIISVQGLIRPIEGTSLDLEYGTGEKNGKQDNAFAAQLLGNQQWITYNMRYVDAGSDYGGYYRDTKFFSSSINLRPVDKFRIETYMRLEDRNLARDTNQIYAPHNASYQIGAGYSNYISIYYLNNYQQDKFDIPKYQTREEAIQARLGYSFSFVSVYANMDFGKTRDDLKSVKSPYKRFSLSTSFNLFAGHTYGTSAEYSEFFDIYTGENQERVSGNFNASIFLGESTQMQMNIFGSRVDASIRQTYSMFEGSIEHILPFRHKIILRGRHTIITPSIRNSEDAYALEYEIPIGLPIKRLTSIGQLRGSVLDEEGKGAANVLINIGDNKTLTDRNGLFSFGALKPGTAYLSVDKASIGFDRITDKPMPLELTIKGGEEQTLVLRVARSITIAGEVILFGTKQTGILDTTTAIEELGGRAGVFLEISSSTETHRRVSDSRGRFQFTDIRPGEWVFKIIGGDIPAYHTITPESVNIKLLPGERKDIRIEIKPRRRTIRMLEGNLSVPPQLAPKPEKPVNVSVSQPAVTPRAEKQAIVKLSPSISGEIKKKESATSTTLPHKPCMITYVEKRKGYILQISSWVTKSKADKVAKIMDNIEGLRTYKQSANIPSIGKRYRVYIGDFKTREEAMEFCYSFDFDF